MSRLAIILCEGSPTKQHLRLGHILDFFGVPWKTVEVSEFSDVGRSCEEYVLFGPAHAVAAALEHAFGDKSVPRPAAFYIHASEDWGASERGFHLLSGGADFSLRPAPAGNLPLQVSGALPDLAGPMSGLKISTALRKEDAVLVGPAGDESRLATVVSAGGAPVFVRFQLDGIPAFFCASSHMIDIDQTLDQGFYDIKDDFCSAVPLILFLKFMFPDAWRPQELGACLIVDDPLLRQRYGSCNFETLRDLMRRHGFTTNIAFIPWNWRRTSREAGEFFRNESGRFSVSIHGCDHIGAEFGTTSPEVLNRRARLAQSRMRNHQARTGIHHDPIMIFPQGVFSSACPEVLKRNGFLAAVNTEVAPVDSRGGRTRIRDAWDVAIMAYSGFAIFTRRYASHGLENFAFDLLLGKPCLIVSHHDFFGDGGVQLLELMEKLQSLNCCLRWKPLGDVIRGACRRRAIGAGVEEVEMYGNELVIYNPSDHAIEVRVRKKDDHPGLVSEVLCDQKPSLWAAKINHLAFVHTIRPKSQGHFQVFYREPDGTSERDRWLPFELSVAVRRILSEFRDDYLSKSRFLSTTLAGMKNLVARVN